MTREIKFRAWKPSTKEWIENVFVMGDGWHYTESIDDHEPELVLQLFTGLYDSKGKPIYEGDILLMKNYAYEVNADHMQGIREVVFNTDAARFEATDFVPLNWGGTETKTVIGNVFENPELLK